MTITMKDLWASLGPVSTLAPAARTAAATGAGVRLAPFDSTMILAHVGALTDGTHTLTVQDSDDGSTWADVAAHDLAGAFVPLTANSVQTLSYMGLRQHLRVNSASSGATGAVFGVAIVRGNPRTKSS